ncbi:MAG: hypothetical protein B7X04_01295 [Parcubacteria group bacterium 21-54-25]|nr:MAG: hypothetical protein B7X04_01295 [Parcubacteria group bacterium 21-54-25]HQU07566.1 hypothetical protein [Candidatus Paceibacterota bacterium]
MKRIVVLFAVLLVPIGAFAAAQNTVTTTASSDQNVYLVSGSVTVATSTLGDLTAIGGSVTTSSFVGGDALLAGGSILLQGRVVGDARLVGGQVTVSAPVGGDLAVAAASIEDTAAHARRIFAVGGTVRLESGSRGAVTVYGNDVYLSGTFDGNVHISALNTLTLAPHTVIHGTLRYEASEVALIPDSASVDGGVTYTGASFLPTSQEAAAFALAGIGIFFLVRILGALIIAGLLAGLFPVFTNRVANDVLKKSARHVLLLLLLGFGVLVATPVLIILLALTFVGLGIAFILGAAYALLIILAIAYAGIISGAALSRALMKRPYTTWRDAIFGMLVLMLVGIIPFVGGIVTILLTCLAAGALVSLFYTAAFTRTDAGEGSVTYTNK